MSFSSMRDVKSSRKASRCLQCNQMIEVGEPKRVSSGQYDGDFYSYDEHLECWNAASEYMHDTKWWDYSENGVRLCEDASRKDDGPWFREHHPIVAARLGLSEPAP